MRRKLFCYSLFVLAGTCFFVPMQESPGVFIMLLALAFFMIRRDQGHSWRWYFAAFLFGMMLLAVSQYQYACGNSSLPNSNGEVYPMTGIVAAYEKKDDAWYRLTIDVGTQRVLASYYQKLDSPWQLIGKTISFEGRLSLPEKAGNPRTFDYRQYLRSCGIAYICTIDRISVENQCVRPRYHMKSLILEKRERYLQTLSIGETADGVLRGLLFGDKSQMDEDVYEAFRKNGTAHVLAVSGLHVGMLYAIYRRIYAMRKSRCLTIIFLIFLMLYGTAALWSVSVTRAVGLILLIVLGRAANRRYDLLTALSFMALISVINNPYVIFGAGFQMSFLAVLSISFLQRPFSWIIGEKWAVLFAVQIGLLPYMAYTFNYVSFVGILCNIPVVFLASILVPFGMLGFILFLATGTMVPLMAQILDTVTQMMIWCNGIFAADGILSFDVISPPLWLLVLFYGLGFFCSSEYFYIYFHRRDWEKVLIPILLVIVCTVSAWFACQTPFDKAELVFVDVGQGDSLHVKTQDGIQALIDGGGRYEYDVGKNILKPYLLKNRIKEIDLAAATHLHMDHYKGLEELDACYPVKQLLTEGEAGQILHLGNDVSLELLWPVTKKDTEDENENSLIIMVHHNGLKTLVTGDITAEGEAMLLNHYKNTGKLKADILKISHHGSVYSSSDAFLDVVKPEVAVISVGKNNYGHPSEIVVEKLEEKGIMVFRTDLDGAVGIINRKGNLSVCTEKQR